MKAKKKIEEAAEPPQETPMEPLVDTTQVASMAAAPELDRQLFRQKQLLNLRDAMLSNGIDSLSKLDAILSQVNEEVKRLTS